jgi:LPXTG-motif cell wall-anchored protein
MSEIIVLGLIPGTHLQITFLLWLAVIIGGGGFVVIRRRRRQLRDLVITTGVIVAMRRLAV